jgi:hypothetical protein
VREVKGLPGVTELDGHCDSMQGHVGGTELDAEVVDRLDEAATEGDAAKMRPDEGADETDPEESGR